MIRVIAMAVAFELLPPDTDMGTNNIVTKLLAQTARAAFVRRRLSRAAYSGRAPRSASAPNTGSANGV